MPGRPLRRARRQAVDSLTDEQAHQVARIAVVHIDRVAAIAVIVAAVSAALPRAAARPVLVELASLSLSSARHRVGELIEQDPQAARHAISMCVQHPAVEQALNIQRPRARARATENPDRPVKPDGPSRARAREGA